MLFADRSEAGRRLADKLTDLRGEDVVAEALETVPTPPAEDVFEAAT